MEHRGAQYVAADDSENRRTQLPHNPRESCNNADNVNKQQAWLHIEVFTAGCKPWWREAV
jgi:hypothetical protein